MTVRSAECMGWDYFCDKVCVLSHCSATRAFPLIGLFLTFCFRRETFEIEDRFFFFCSSRPIVDEEERCRRGGKLRISKAAACKGKRKTPPGPAKNIATPSS